MACGGRAGVVVGGVMMGMVWAPGVQLSLLCFVCLLLVGWAGRCVWFGDWVPFLPKTDVSIAEVLCV